MLGLPLTFVAPLVLAALVALPAIWLLLRVTPPQPRRIDFPPLRILADLMPEQNTPARTPWWLLLLRLSLAALIIFASAGPVWNPAAGTGRGALLVILDGGFTAARDWRERVAFAGERIEAAARDSRIVAIVSSAEKAGEIEALPPAAALERLRALRPQPYLADRRLLLPGIERFLASRADAEAIWISDGVVGAGDEGFADELARIAGARSLSVVQAEHPLQLALASAENGAARLTAHVVRPEASGRDGGSLRALDLKGLPVAEATFAFPRGATATEAHFVLPMELRNAIARIDIAGEASAGAVALLDERGKRRRVGLLFGGSADQAQPLLAPTFYLARALQPFADVREAHGGVADGVTQLIDQQVSVLALADVGTLDRDTLAKTRDFVSRGGVLLRFAGTRLAAGNDDLVPVKLRRGGRSLGGALSWDTPRTLAPFTRESPFFGLPVPADLGVRRQILAEPDGDLTRKTWASLVDGTPIVTAERVGNGLVILFHLTADAAWSNLPLTGLFVDMLRRITVLSGATEAVGSETRASDVQLIPPQRVLDGYGAFVAPPATARAVPRNHAERASESHPPGFYGPADASLAVNALVAGDRLAVLPLGGLAGRVAPLVRAETIDLRAPLFTAALILLLIDTFVSLWLGGHLARFRPVARAAAASLALVGLAALAAGDARAQDGAPKAGFEAALVTRLAYVVTGDAQVDATSRAGMAGLRQVLSSRTALEAGEPVGIDLARDELAFYPLLYLPIVAGQSLPGEAAIRKLDGFIKAGGTVIFDTRDAMSARAGGTPTPETLQLRRMLATLDIPELEPVPRDHVLTKTFYLLDSFPGRYATGQTWVEALPPATEGERRPARAGDGVSPIIITGNDLAAAWAVGRRGESLYPVVGGDQRQREMAYRGGINIVMYTLTGNYKADQVHVPALLERLGQ